MQKTTLKVEGMSCGHCVSAVEGALKRIGAEGRVNLQAKSVDVEFDDTRVTMEQIKEAIEDQGYDVVQ